MGDDGILYHYYDCWFFRPRRCHRECAAKNFLSESFVAIHFAIMGILCDTIFDEFLKKT